MQHDGLSRPGSRFLRPDWWRACVAACLPLAMTPSAQALESPDLIAAAVYNVLQFVEWPREVHNARGVTVLCVDAGGRLNAHLKRLQGQPLNGRRLEVTDIGRGANALEPCHAVFLDGGSRQAHEHVTRLSPQHPVLVLADASAATSSPMVRLTHESGFVGFRVDLGATRRAQLHVSSRLLRLARKVIE